MQKWQDIKASAVQRFAAAHFGGPVAVYENPTEELIAAGKARKAITLHQRGMEVGPRRLEENYLYSTRRFASGALGSTEYRFFQNAIGQDGTGDGFAGGTTLTDLETNMDVGGQIAQGKSFIFRQIGVSFNSDITTGDLAQLMDAGALRFSKQGDQYNLRHGPLRLWPGGTGISGFATTTVAATTVQGAHNGNADIRAVRNLRVPRVIRQKESFAYVYNVPRTTRFSTAGVFTLTNACLMTVWLWGGQMDRIPG
jgi:hypothetical protein